MAADISSTNRLRVGAVRYLNTKPLVYGLADDAPEIELLFDLPSRLADRLAAGELDVALVPSVEVLHHQDWAIVSDACIACRGPVWSVKLFSRVPPAEIRSLALDEGSRTSVALAQILLSEQFGIQPTLLPLPIGAAPAASDADAVLLIGDRAIHPPAEKFAAVWDLGDQWHRWAGLPFVFAMWAARPGVDAQNVGGRQVGEALSAARDHGVADLKQIAAEEAAAVGLTPDECLHYFHDSLHFHLGQRERAGLQLFYEHAARRGLAPADVRLRFDDCVPTT